MADVSKSIEVDVPVTVAYNQWTQFETFPQFMSGVKEVRQLDDKTLRWHAEIGGKDVHWTATITHQEPDRIIGWRSTSGEANAGVVTFEPLAPNRARVNLRIEYEPKGLVEKAGSAVGVVSATVDSDLKRFKEFIESMGAETGAWRGEIRGGHVDQPRERSIEGGAP